MDFISHSKIYLNYMILLIMENLQYNLAIAQTFRVTAIVEEAS